MNIQKQTKKQITYQGQEIQGVREKNDQCIKCPGLKWIREIATWNLHYFHKWTLGFWMPFISAKLDIAIRRFSQDKSRYQLCHFSLNQLIRLFCPIQQKSGTIGIVTSLGKMAISPNCNIHMGCNELHSKAKFAFVTLIYVSCHNYFYLLKTRAFFSLHIFFGHPVHYLLHMKKRSEFQRFCRSTYVKF